MSATLIQCSRPFGPGILFDKGPGSEAAKFGLSWHACAAWAIPRGKLPTMKQFSPVVIKTAREYEVPHLALELEAHLFASLPKLFVWLNAIPRKPQETIELLIEKSFALNPVTGQVREIDNPTVEDHHYTNNEGEIPGTLDLAVIVGVRNPRQPLGWKSVSAVYMTDHKTGQGDFSRPDKLPQILTLALMLLGHLRAQGVRKTPRVIGGVFHAFRRGIAKMYEDDIDPEALRTHQSDLAKAFTRIGDGTMRNGPLCKLCPARTGCPAGDSDLLLKAEALIKRVNVAGSQMLLTANSNATKMTANQKLGALYEVIKNGEDLAARAREEIKREMNEGALPELSNGKILILDERLVERLSKKEFLKAYGKIAAERLFEKWRKDGALMKKGETFMRPVDD